MQIKRTAISLLGTRLISSIELTDLICLDSSLLGIHSRPVSKWERREEGGRELKFINNTFGSSNTENE